MEPSAIGLGRLQEKTKLGPWHFEGTNDNQCRTGGGKQGEQKKAGGKLGWGGVGQTTQGAHEGWRQA